MTETIKSSIFQSTLPFIAAISEDSSGYWHLSQTWTIDCFLGGWIFFFESIRLSPKGEAEVGYYTVLWDSRYQLRLVALALSTTFDGYHL